MRGSSPGQEWSCDAHWSGGPCSSRASCAYAPTVREQRTVFGEVADLYDKARAPYPEALLDDVLDHARVTAATAPRAFEIGAGTGKATVALAARGVHIVATEPDEAMAAVLRRNCRAFPHVRVDVSNFEDWTGSERGFDLVYAAQAWHWIARRVRVNRAAELLRPQGTIALFWHRTDWGGESVRDDLEDIYRRIAPDLHGKQPGFPGLSPPGGEPSVAELIDADAFGDVQTRAYHWSVKLSAERFVEMALTQSNHRLTDEATRERLFGAVGALVASHGGHITVPHATFLVMARAT